MSAATPLDAIFEADAPRAPPAQYATPLGTRWQKEKAAAGGERAFEFPDDPKYIGPWILGECVGKGASGRVKLAKHRRTGQLAAVKILPLEPSFTSRHSLRTRDAKSAKFRLGIDREIITMKLMRHPNIMRIYDVYEGERELYLVLEYVEGGELFDFLVNSGRMPPQRALAYFKQIIAGLNYAHTFSIVHRDLKPENILIQSIDPPIIKIADWGMAAFNPPASQLGTSCGSPHYASPEIVNGEKYCGPMSDIWSCGVILYALLTGRLPFDDKDVRKLLGKVRVGQYELYDWLDPQARDLISRMLVVDVTKRITMAEILEHPWMLNPTPGIIVHPAPSVADLARPFTSSAFIEEEVLESLHVVCGKQMSLEQLTAELCSPAGQGDFVKAFYYLLDQHRRLTLHENGIYLDVHDPSARTVSRQYTRPVSRTASANRSVTLDVDPTGRRLTPKTPPLGPLPPLPENRHGASPTRNTPVRRASSPIYDLRRSPLSRPPVSPSRSPFHSPSRPHRSRLPSPSRPRYAQRARTMPSSREPSPTPSTPPVYSPVLTESPVVGAVLHVNPQPGSPGTEHAFLRPEAVHRPMLDRGNHAVFAAPRVQDAVLQSSIDAIAHRMNALSADQDRGFGVRSRAATEIGAPHDQAPIAHEMPRRRAETAAPKHANKENAMVSPSRYNKNDNVLGVLKVHKVDDFKRKGRPAPLNLQGDANRRPLGASALSPPVHCMTPQSPVLLSPPVELRGWFQNLFSWNKDYPLHSRESVATTRRELARILTELGVGLVGEDIGGRLALRCVVEDGALICASDALGPEAFADAKSTKGVSFRVELSTIGSPAADSFLPLSPGLPPSRRSTSGRSATGALGMPGETLALLVQEKGSLGTFRAVCHTLRHKWTLDAPTPTVMAPGRWTTHEQAHGQFVF